MGMFDTVKVPCPKCSTINFLQSKGGECFLYDYDMPGVGNDPAPMDVMADINLHAPHKCSQCNILFIIKLVTEPKWEVVEIPDTATTDLDIG